MENLKTKKNVLPPWLSLLQKRKNNFRNHLKMGDLITVIKEKIFFLSLVAIGFVSCEDRAIQNNPVQPTRNTTHLSMITCEGDTIPTGVPYFLTGTELSSELLPAPEVFNPETREVQFDQPNKYKVKKTGVIHWPQKLPERIPGQGGLALPVLKSIITDSVLMPKPVYSAALAFQNVSRGVKAFQYLDVDQGLPSSFINDIMKDSKGYFWIALNEGLVKYDGKSFFQYDFSKVTKYKGVAEVLEDSRWKFMVAI